MDMEYFEEGEDEPSVRPASKRSVQSVIKKIILVIIIAYFVVAHVATIYFLIVLSIHYSEPQTYLMGIYELGFSFIFMPTSTNDVGPLMMLVFLIEGNALLLPICFLCIKSILFLKKHKK